jgi:hypothetical protein
MGYDISLAEVILVQHGASLDILNDVSRASQNGRCGKLGEGGYHTHGMFQYSLLYVPLNGEDKL